MPGYRVVEHKMLGTGVVRVNRGWIENGAGGRSRSDVQAVHEVSGQPLWDVEVLYETTTYGEPSSVTAMVTVAAASLPVVGVLVPVQFEGLRVDVYISKAKALVERWSATALTAGDASAAAVGRAPRASGGESA